MLYPTSNVAFSLHLFARNLRLRTRARVRVDCELSWDMGRDRVFFRNV